ncbi:hypothetical protein YT1_p10105 (plasmid) [Rhodococcus ruber]|nr:hypothetical protein YT1_p10105 [Rhodococcus ruber]
MREVRIAGDGPGVHEVSSIRSVLLRWTPVCPPRPGPDRGAHGQ